MRCWTKEEREIEEQDLPICSERLASEAHLREAEDCDGKDVDEWRVEIAVNWTQDTGLPCRCETEQYSFGSTDLRAGRTCASGGETLLDGMARNVLLQRQCVIVSG